MPVTRRAPQTWTAAMLTAVMACPAAAQDTGDDRRRAWIERHDTDGDGRLSPDEREAARAALRGRLGAVRPEAAPPTIDRDATPLYAARPGPHAVHTVATVELADEDRDKTIPLRIDVPKAERPEGGFPLVLFCHGALGSKDGGDPLAEHWASHGYVVIRPTFGDSISLMTPEEKREAMRAGPRALVNGPRVSSRWDDRPRDVSHVLDRLDELERGVEGLEPGTIDRDRIAVAGHSFGAHTTMLLCGLKLRDPRTGRTAGFADARVKAGIIISPQGPTEAITEAAYRGIDRPALMITGDHDGTPIRGREDKAGAWRRQAFDLADPADKFLLWIKGARHGFGGINGEVWWPGAGPRSADQVLIVQSATTALLDAYLKRRDEARAFLSGHAMAEHTDGLASITTRGPE